MNVSATTTRVQPVELASFDMDRRDLHNMNGHIQVEWCDVIAEPESIYSPDYTWQCSYRCYRAAKNCCYRALTVVLAPLLAFCLGCQFALLAFQHIWCFVPCLRCLRIHCSAVRDATLIVLEALLSPWLTTCGQCLSRIKIRHQKVAELQDDIDYTHI